MREQRGPSAWDKATLVCLEDGSEILNTAALKEHVSAGHHRFALISSKLAPFERAINIDLVCRLYHKLTEIDGARAIRANLIGLRPEWKERMEVSIASEGWSNITKS